MRVVLDTTYFLPAVGISVKEISTEDVLSSLSKTSDPALCQITIFELCAKAAKYVAEGKLETRRAHRGIQAVIEDDSIKKLDPYESGTLSVAIQLREMLGDFIDCLILATAISQADVLLTEDRSIHDLRHQSVFRELVKSENPDFEIRKI
ncbi:MAG: PIN domain-containing protein [Nitrososphaerota archaeon]|nr:PIN domain-containing protein [Nitrososphaerota archaeon]